jgi:hypothetical protein
MLDRSPPVLLLQSDFTGTLAATRCLGGRGVPVTLAGGSPLAPARWSRFARHVVDGPDLREPSAILACRVESAEEMPEAFRAEREGAVFAQELLARIPDAGMPMVQVWASDASSAIYTVSGFSGQGGKLFCARGSRKVMQRPRDLGVGICFESAPLEPGLEQQLQRLCALAGYQGAFDIEFLEVAGRKLLIDFNPRFYNQMAFEIDRGLPTPWLCWLGAIGDEVALGQAVGEAFTAEPAPGSVFCDQFAAAHTLALQRLAGAVPAFEEQRWRRWYRDHGEHRTDPVARKGDRAPQIAEVLSEVAAALRHPRSFLRKTALGRG